MLKKVQGAFWIGHTGCNSYPAKLFQKAAKASEDVGQAKDGFKNGDGEVIVVDLSLVSQ